MSPEGKGKAMAYTYKPMYYSSFQDSITSLCISILPFSSKNRRLAADRKLSRRHAENLKWQQDSYHRILNLIGLYREGVVPEAEVSAFRFQLLATLIASSSEEEPSTIIRDKLLFLQELFYGKCISAEEYHSSKRPLLQRLAAQGVEIDSRDVIIGAPPLLKNSEEEWCDIDLSDRESPKVVEKYNERTPLKLLWRGTVKKEGSNTKEKDGNRDMKSTQIWPSITANRSDRSKRKPFHALFQREKQDEESANKNTAQESKQRVEKSLKNQWGFESLKKWKRSSCEDESVKPYLQSAERSDDASPLNQCKLAASLASQEPDTKRIKKKSHSNGSASDFFIDKVLGENMKKEFSRIQTELSATNQNLNFSEDQIEAISMKLPVDKADLNEFFPKSWCNTHGDIVLDVVKEEFKGHVGEMKNHRTASRDKENDFSGHWVAFEDDDDESFHPNLFTQVQLSSNRQVNDVKSSNDGYLYNPF